MNADRALRALVQGDLLYDVSTNKYHCVTRSAVLRIGAQFAEMLDCSTGDP